LALGRHSLKIIKAMMNRLEEKVFTKDGEKCGIFK
jgi:hypothetical protein